MNLINRILVAGLVLALFTLFNHCGSDPAKEGEKAFQEGDYSRAILHFSKAKKENPNDQSFSEKIALSYILHGQNLYEKTKNIKSFSGNFERAQDFIPEEPSESFKKDYSRLLTDLAKAYQKSKPQNEIQKQEFLNKSIEHLQDAIYQYPDNTEANELLDQIKADNFQKMLDKGKDFYQQAIKENNVDLFFSAEFYFKKAANFNPFDEESKELLSKTRQRTLRVLDYRQPLAIAVVEQKYVDGALLLDIDVQNNTSDAVDLKLDRFDITDRNGNNYAIDRSALSKLSKNVFSDQTLGVRKRISGIVAFNVPKNVSIESLRYEMEDGNIVQKFFP